MSKIKTGIINIFPSSRIVLSLAESENTGGKDNGPV